MAAKQRLELTWVGKEDRPRLEPRILLEDKSKSYGAHQDPLSSPNLLICGDNLLALKALETTLSGKFKCIYIDPPFNADAAELLYDDNVEHSAWLSMIRERLILLRRLMRSDGSLFLHLDDNELDYAKVLLDEIFGRDNFISRITAEARAPSAFSTVNPGVFKASEYLLWYAKDRGQFEERPVRVPRTPDYAYSKWLDNPEQVYSHWTTSSVLDAYTSSFKNARETRNPVRELEKFNQFIVENAHRVCRLASISDTGAGKDTVDLKYRSAASPGVVLRQQRSGYDDIYALDGQQLLFYKKNVVEIDRRVSASMPLTNIWSDIAWEGIAGEGGVTFKKGKKPERLIRRCLLLATEEGDLVLDSFAGSGTTGAVAHKLRRRWVMIEAGEHCDTHILPRLRRVIDGQDGTGITEVEGWKGGGSFRYYRLAPSLLKKDKWGNWVISDAYNPEMLSEAVCKHMGFTYAPSADDYWNHGRSSERDFIYVTTANLTDKQLRALSEEVGPSRSLLICCKAFHAPRADRFENLTVRKIPKAVLTRCEWGRDDYSLNARSAPAEPEGESGGEEAEATPRPARTRRAAQPAAPDLFDDAET